MTEEVISPRRAPTIFAILSGHTDNPPSYYFCSYPWICIAANFDQGSFFLQEDQVLSRNNPECQLWMGHLCPRPHPMLWGQGGRGEPGGQGEERKVDFWTCQACCTHQLTSVMVTCTRSSQSAFQHQQRKELSAVDG